MLKDSTEMGVLDIQVDSKICLDTNVEGKLYYKLAVGLREDSYAIKQKVKLKIETVRRLKE